MYPPAHRTRRRPPAARAAARARARRRPRQSGGKARRQTAIAPSTTMKAISHLHRRTAYALSGCCLRRYIGSSCAVAAGGARESDRRTATTTTAVVAAAASLAAAAAATAAVAAPCFLCQCGSAEPKAGGRSAPPPESLRLFRPSLPLATAAAVVDASLALRCERGLLPLAVVVLDAGGGLVAAKREDGCAIMRTDIAAGKAFGALSMGMCSRQMRDRLSGRPTFMTVRVISLYVPSDRLGGSRVWCVEVMMAPSKCDAEPVRHRESSRQGVGGCSRWSADSGSRAVCRWSCRD
jgi:uncharacterized protein GlcG (DUF336 family)